MTIFYDLFGTKPLSIKRVCILTPFINKDISRGFGVEKLSKGALYSVGNSDFFSLIHTRMGAPFVGDAVLHLADTPCKNMIFFGSAGATAQSNLKIGRNVIVKKAICRDSFTDMLLMKKPSCAFYPSDDLVKAAEAFTSDRHINQATCLSVGSLKLEEDYVNLIGDASVDVIDMETASFFAAAEFARKNALSLLYITDILGKQPYYRSLKKENLPAIKKIVNASIQNAVELAGQISGV